jgi:hypothetical protein
MRMPPNTGERTGSTNVRNLVRNLFVELDTTPPSSVTIALAVDAIVTEAETQGMNTQEEILSAILQPLVERYGRDQVQVALNDAETN